MHRHFAAACGIGISVLLMSACIHRHFGGQAPAAALDAIDGAGWMERVRVLSSDDFEGRLPGSAGERKTIDYLTAEFRRIGAAPGNPDGTYVQDVPLVSLTASPDMALTFDRGGERTTLRYGEQFMGWTKRVAERTEARDSEVVFVGYGAVAPEFEWDDFKGMDVTDKTLIMLVNDPPVPDPNDPAQLDAGTFGGRAMTYYGRWTYKFEVAAQMGAAAAFVVHEIGPAGYPWEVVSGSWAGEQFDLVAADDNMSRCAVEGWLTHETAVALFERAGLNFEEMKAAAMRRDFQPRSLGTRASIATQNRIQRVNSQNVIARIDGVDPELKDEYVVYMAHWDHLGRDASLQGDRIYNGAQDNATGTAGLIELAEAFAAMQQPPRRSLLFLAVTAEEKGLLGSRHYAENPLYPLARTVAAINMDGMNVFGRTRDIVIIGMGNSTMDDITGDIAAAQGRVVKPDAEPEKGFFYRSDHFNFAKFGVPALYTDSGVEYLGRPEGWGLERREECTRLHYHKPADEFDPTWDPSGAIEDLHLLFLIGHRLAIQPLYPQWKPGTEFKAVRERMLQEAGIGR